MVVDGWCHIAFNTGHGVALCGITPALTGGGKRHWGWGGTYIHRSTQIRKMRVLTTISVYASVYTQGYVVITNDMGCDHIICSSQYVTICYNVVTFSVTMSIRD